MNVAIIIAGGSGNRMGQDIPKQFLNVYDNRFSYIRWRVFKSMRGSMRSSWSA